MPLGVAQQAQLISTVDSGGASDLWLYARRCSVHEAQSAQSPRDFCGDLVPFGAASAAQYEMVWRTLLRSDRGFYAVRRCSGYDHFLSVQGVRDCGHAARRCSEKRLGSFMWSR